MYSEPLRLSLTCPTVVLGCLLGTIAALRHVLPVAELSRDDIASGCVAVVEDKKKST